MKQKFIFSTLAFTFFGLMFILAPNIAPSFVNTTSAQTTTTTTSSPCTTGADCAQQGLNGIRDIFPRGSASGNWNVQDIAKLVINWALYIATIAAVIMIIVGGYNYIFSNGNETTAGKGRQTLINALIGLAIIILSYVIVQIVYNFLKA